MLAVAVTTKTRKQDCPVLTTQLSDWEVTAGNEAEFLLNNEQLSRKNRSLVVLNFSHVAAPLKTLTQLKIKI